MKGSNVFLLVFLCSCAAFVLGGGTGFLVGVTVSEAGKEFIAELNNLGEMGAFALEEPADVANAKDASDGRYELKYPGNWSFDDDWDGWDEEVDQIVSIDSVEASWVWIEIFDRPVDAAEKLNTEVQEMIDNWGLENVTQTEFDAWGEYSGRGQHVRGGMDDYLVEGRVFVYTPEEGDRSFVVIEYWYDEDRPMVQPGFELIENSFRLLPGQNAPQAGAAI